MEEKYKCSCGKMKPLGYQCINPLTQLCDFIETPTDVSDEIINRKCRTKHDELILQRKNHIEGKGQRVGNPMSSHEITAHIDGFEQGAKWMRSLAQAELKNHACEFLRQYRAYLHESHNYHDERTEEEFYEIYRESCK